MLQNLLNQFLPLFFIVFLVTSLTAPYWIRKAKKAGLSGRDVHKKEEKQVAEMGGITVLLGFIIGIMLYIAMRIFILNADSKITPLLAIIVAVLIAGIIGIIDDILGWKIGLRQWQKPMLTLLVAFPIMAVDAGTRMMSFPLIGKVDLGLLYPLIVIPAFILVGTNGFNMLAGFNGLEAGQGMIIHAALAYFTFTTGSAWLSVVALCMVAALAGFYLFNYYPARLFPGDTLTYTVGALAAVIAIFANLEKVFIILFIPYIIEFFLKLKGLFQKESFGKVQPDGTLINRYHNIYGLEHLVIKGFNLLRLKTTERKVVYTLNGLQIVCVLLAMAI